MAHISTRRPKTRPEAASGCALIMLHVSRLCPAADIRVFLMVNLGPHGGHAPFGVHGLDLPEGDTTFHTLKATVEGDEAGTECVGSTRKKSTRGMLLSLTNADWSVGSVFPVWGASSMYAGRTWYDEMSYMLRELPCLPSSVTRNALRHGMAHSGYSVRLT